MRFKKNIFILLFLLFSPFLKAQTTLDELLSLVDAQNLNLRASNARIEQRIVESNSSAPIAPMDFIVEYGNIQNTGTGDYLIGINQTFTNPGKIKSLKNLYKANVGVQESQANRLKIAVHKAVRNSYFQMAFLIGKKKILNDQLILFQDMARVTEARIIAGETSVLEKLSITSKLFEIENETEQMTYRYEEILLGMQGLLNTEDTLIFEFSKQFRIAQTDVLANPDLIYLNQAKSSALQNTLVQKAQLKPDFSLGAFNQSMDNLYKQFYFRAGIGIPIFSKAEKSKIEVSQINEKIIDLEIQAQQREIESKMNSLQKQLEGHQKAIGNYQDKLIPEAKSMIEKASLRFKEGELSFAEFYLSHIMYVRFLHELESVWLKYHLGLSEIDYLNGV